MSYVDLDDCIANLQRKRKVSPPVFYMIIENTTNSLDISRGIIRGHMKGGEN